MNKEIEEKLSKYNNDVKDLFLQIRKIIYDTNLQIEERIWASLPSYYNNENFIRIIPFKDYINIEAKAVLNYKESLNDYKITPKGMLRIAANEPVPITILKTIIKETLQ